MKPSDNWLRDRDATLLREELGRLCAAIALADFNAKSDDEEYPRLSDWQEIVALANAAERFL